MYVAGRLVGREGETAAMAQLAAAARAGAGQTAFVVGEAGLGKTALLELTAGTAGSLGMRVLHGAAPEVEQQRPFAVISACLRVDSKPPHPSTARAAEIQQGEGRYGTPALLAGLCGGAPGPRLCRMAEGAAGNPLYVMELATALLREDAIELRDGLAEVPVDRPLPSLTKLIAHRLRYLRDEVLQALRVASVLGSGCTVTDLAAVLDRPTDNLLSIVAKSEGAGVLQDTGDRLVFRHDLIRHALYDAVSGSTRAMLHLRTAQALARDGAPPERVAEHLLVAAPAAGDFLVDWLLESAVRITSRAPSMARLLFDRALALTDSVDPRRDQLQLHRAVAQLASGRLAEAEETARCALATTCGPGWEGPLRWIVVHASFARGEPHLALVETYAACSSPGVSALEAVQFRAFSALCLFALGRLPEAGAVATAIRRAAETMDDDAALAHALHVLAAKRLLEAPDTEALELARHAARLTPETTHPAQRIALQLTLANGYMGPDRSHEAQRALAAVHESVEHTGGFFLPCYHLSCALLAFHADRWDDALREVKAGLHAGEHVAMCRALRAVAALISVHRGRQICAETPPNAEAAPTNSTTLDGFYAYKPLSADALADEAQGRPESAYARLAVALDCGVGHLMGHLILCSLTPDLVRLALAHDDTTNARRYADAARRRPTTAVPPTTLVMPTGATGYWPGPGSASGSGSPLPEGAETAERGTRLHRRGGTTGTAGTAGPSPRAARPGVGDLHPTGRSVERGLRLVPPARPRGPPRRAETTERRPPRVGGPHGFRTRCSRPCRRRSLQPRDRHP